MLYKNTNSSSSTNSSTNRYPTPNLKPAPIGLNKQTGIFSAKLAGALGAGGYGLNKINDLNDHPNNISDFGHVGKVLGIGENEASVGTSVGSSSEAMPSTGGTFPILKDKSPLDKLDFKEKLKNLKIRRGTK